MAVRIVNVHTEALPALRLIGKRCLCHPKDFTVRWSEWFQKGWFEQLGKLGVAPENGDAYLGVTQHDEYWIGLLFPPNTPVPDSFECADIPAARYAVFGMDGKKGGELFGEEGITLVLGEMGKRGLAAREDGWGLERYRCPRSAAPEEKANTLFEFLITIE